MTDRLTEIRARLAAMGFDRLGHADEWTIDPHGDGEALMLGSDSRHHGLNMIFLSDPAHQWSQVRPYLLAAMNGAPALLAAHDDLEDALTQARAEIERLTRERDEALDNADVSHKKAHRFSLERDAAFRAGAEAMRTAAGQHVMSWDQTCNAKLLRAELRALPIPEPKR
jgi:hypothetical protein